MSYRHSNQIVAISNFIINLKIIYLNTKNFNVQTAQILF